MNSGHLADLVVLLHALFVAFAALGGLLAVRWPRAAWAHLPCALWGVVIELTGWVCPLTPLEVHLRRLAGEAGYSGGFIQHYLTPLLYPAGLTHADQWVLGLALCAFNAGVYGLAWRRWRRRRR